MRLFVLVAAGLSVLATGACSGAEEAPMTLTVSAQTWAGAPDADSAQESVTLPADEGESVELPLAQGERLEVSGRDGERVELTTSVPMAPAGDGGGINLRDTRTDFSLAPGEPVEFSTPSMDSGTTWTITVAP